MKLILILISFTITAYCSSVKELDGSNLKELQSSGLALVEFFAPWCGKCRNFEPEFEKAAAMLKTNDPPVTLVKVDCMTEYSKSICNQLNVSEYPTFKIFRNGEFSEDYKGEMTVEDIIYVMKSKAGPPVIELTNTEDYEKLVELKKTVVISLLNQGDTVNEIFIKVAQGELSLNYKFYSTDVPEIIEKLGQSNTIVLMRPKYLHNKFEDFIVVHEESASDVTQQNLENYIKDNAHGLCGHMTQQNIKSFKKPLIIAFYDVDFKNNIKSTNYWRNRVMKVKQKFNKYSCAVASVLEFSSQIESYGLDADKENVQVVVEDEEGKKFPMKKEFTMENFEKFLRQMENGKVRPYIRSEPVPETNDGPVKVVVGKTFNKIVYDKTKNVLIEFYAPWCGHCKALEPLFVKLAEKTAKYDNIVIAKMDSTENDAPAEFEINGYPTLYWVSANNKIEQYKGRREIADFVDFISKKLDINMSSRKIKKRKNKNEL